MTLRAETLMSELFEILISELLRISVVLSISKPGFL